MKDEATLRKLAQTEASQNLAKDMKKRGWKFFGPTTAYAFMQAMGLVNDHMDTCFAHEKAEAARKNFTPTTAKIALIIRALTCATGHDRLTTDPHGVFSGRATH